MTDGEKAAKPIFSPQRNNIYNDGRGGRLIRRLARHQVCAQRQACSSSGRAQKKSGKTTSREPSTQAQHWHLVSDCTSRNPTQGLRDWVLDGTTWSSRINETMISCKSISKWRFCAWFKATYQRSSSLGARLASDLSKDSQTIAPSAILALKNSTTRTNGCPISTTPLEQNDAQYKRVSKKPKKKEKLTVTKKRTFRNTHQWDRKPNAAFAMEEKREKTQVEWNLVFITLRWSSLVLYYTFPFTACFVACAAILVFLPRVVSFQARRTTHPSKRLVLIKWKSVRPFCAVRGMKLQIII